MGNPLSALAKLGTKYFSKDSSNEQSELWHFEYSTVIKYFLQDSPRTNPGTFDAMRENFGLIEQDYDTDTLLPANGKDLTQWQRFAFNLKILNERAADGVSYRLLYLGRHGQGYHNVGQSFYGDDAWDCYYSTLDSDPHVPGIEFFDAHLTSLGKHQARMASEFWDRLITSQNIPVPQTYYSSPHTRAIQTAKLTFSPLILPSAYPFAPTIKEFLREGHGIHTCDSRPTRTKLEERLPEFDIEDTLTEKDELYSPDRREPPQAHTQRMLKLLDDIVEHDASTYISMTSHSGTIAALLRAIGHRTFLLPTGGIIPVLVQVKKVAGLRPDDGSQDEEWETKPECFQDPLKAGLPPYKDIGQYLEAIDSSVPGNDESTNTAGAYGATGASEKGKEKDDTFMD